MQKVAAHLFFIEPMECKEVKHIHDLPQGRDWQHEVKFDGYRCIAIKQNNAVELFSRSGNSFLHFANLFDPLRLQPPKSFIVDGEIVALDETGRTAFNKLQHNRKGRGKVHFYIFDLLNLDGKALMDQPLSERQRILWKQFKPGDYIHLPQPLDADLDTIVVKIEEFGLEGVIAKRRDSIYTPGRAPGSWVKKKIKRTDEFIIGGFVPGTHGVERLVVGKYSGKKLMFVAMVNNGFIPRTRRLVFEAIRKLIVSDCPFMNLPEKNGLHRLDAEKMKTVTWLNPKTVVEIAMNEWTPDKHLRHGEFQRLRPDKSVKEVSPYPD